MTRTRSIILAAAAAFALAVAAATMAQASGPWNIWLTNGSQAVGAGSITAGNPVTDVFHPGRDMTWSPQGTDGNNRTYGYWKFSNGNFMAANNACNGVTIKSDASANGVIWVEVFTGGNLYYANRYCSGGANRYGQKLESDNQFLDQWSIADQSTCGAGCYFAITLNPS